MINIPNSHAFLRFETLLIWLYLEAFQAEIFYKIWANLASYILEICPTIVQKTIFAKHFKNMGRLNKVCIKKEFYVKRLEHI